MCWTAPDVLGFHPINDLAAQSFLSARGPTVFCFICLFFHSRMLFSIVFTAFVLLSQKYTKLKKKATFLIPTTVLIP